MCTSSESIVDIVDNSVDIFVDKRRRIGAIFMPFLEDIHLELTFC